MTPGFELIGLQMPVVPGEGIENLVRATAMLREAAPAGGSIVVLPEMWLEGFVFPDPEGYCERYKEALRVLAGTLPSGVVLLSDGPVNEGGRFHNAVSAITASDEALLYRKGHLLPGTAEPKVMTPGTSLGALRFAGVLIGALVCFDLRFPVPFRTLSRGGCLGTIVPGQWPSSRIGHWETLLRARAIENQCYILGVNATGTGNPMGGGRSAAFGPFGEPLAALGEEPGIIRVTWDPSVAEGIRARFPFTAAGNPSLDGGDQGAIVTKALLQ
jgi:predicted amidohydrolase